MVDSGVVKLVIKVVAGSDTHEVVLVVLVDEVGTWSSYFVLAFPSIGTLIKSFLSCSLSLLLLTSTTHAMSPSRATRRR